MTFSFADCGHSKLALCIIAPLANVQLTSRVLVDGYEGGLEDVSTLALVQIQTDVNLDRDYFGHHLIDDDAQTEVAVWIKSFNPRGDRLNVAAMQRLKITGWW